MSSNSLPQLDLLSTIAFQGKIRNGLVFHCDKKHIAYAAGQSVMVKDIGCGKEYRLCGHSNRVSCVAVSKDGSLLVSGQENFMGFKADVIVWNFQEKRKYGSHSIHQVKVEAVAFTCDSKYVISLGGQDCGSVVVYDVDSQVPLCGNTAVLAGGYATLLRCANTRNDIFVSAGNNSLRIWKIDFKSKRVTPTNASVGKIKREIKCIDVDKNDSTLYCGTSSGDILKLRLILTDGAIRTYDAKLENCLTRMIRKEIPGDISLFSGGVTALAVLKTGELLIGTGDGIVCRAALTELVIKDPVKKLEDKSSKDKKSKPKIEMRLKETERTLIIGSVTSIALRGDGHQFYVGSDKSEIYRVILYVFECERLYTCHGSAVNDVAFPYQCSDIFVTCSYETIRVWNLSTSHELLRIEIPNMTCSSVFLMQDGRSVISGWNDGKIRAHTPETGKPIYIIENAHHRGVTALAATSNCKRIVSGGGEGDIRVWDVTTSTQVLARTMKEHKGGITCIRMKSNDKECVSSGGDGSCIVWDLENFIRLQVMFANTLFQAVCYGPGEYQIISCGTDRKVTYYEVLDATPVRSLEASLSGSINAMDITDDGEVFVTGGADKLIKVWKYLEGIVTHVGIGHSDEITALRIAPNKNYIVSVDKDGCIISWKFP